MMTDTKPKPQIDGREALYHFIDQLHPNEEHTPVAIQEMLPAGFSIAMNDPDEVTLHGPMGSIRIPTLERWGGPFRIKGLSLLKAVARVLEQGPPDWDRSSERQAMFWRAAIRNAGPFLVEPKDPFPTRASMENHIEGCHVCEPSNKLLIEAISHGSHRYSDAHLRELIEKSHEDQESSVRFYTALRDAHRAPFAPIEKPRRGREVPA